MHLIDVAALWSQTVESEVAIATCPVYKALILNRFAKDEHEMLLRQLFQIHQLGSVAEYTTQFSKLTDQLKAYGGTTDSLYFAMRYVHGLKDHIKAIVALHHPQTWDTAVILAQL